MNKRKHPLAQCEECPLYDRPYVGTTYKDNATIAIVPEAPGRDEVTQDAYLVGASGKILFAALEQVGIQRSDCALFNATMCYPPLRGKNHTPTDDEIHLCSDERLKVDIPNQKPKMILALGNSAMIALFGSKGKGIMKERGKIRQWYGITVLPTVHPASILHGGTAWTDFANDIERIPRVLAGETFEDIPPKVTTISTKEQLRELIDKIKAATPCEIACDIETSGFDYFRDAILCVSLSVTGVKAYTIVQELCTREILTPLFDIEGVEWTYHNAKFDVQFFTTLMGKRVPHSGDTMLKSYVLDERQGPHGLKVQASERLNAPDYESEIRAYLPTKSTSYSVIPKDVLHLYGGYDAGYTRRLSRWYDRQMDSEQTMFYNRVLIPASHLFLEMEREGMLVDQEVLRRLAKDMGEDLLKQEQRLFDVAGEVFNPRSPQQVSKLLYTKLRLPKPTRPKSETATDEECLKFNRGRHEIVNHMLEYRSGHKTYSTYVMGLESTIWYDGRVHATYLIHGAVSRTSCSNPNIQNIPREGPIKNMFIAPEGWEILWLDFSQHEFRMVAVYSGDEWLKQVFADGRNLHKEMSRIVYGDDYTDEEYVAAKMVNFGLLFGREAYSLSLQMGNAVSEAQEMIDAFFTRMPRVRTWQEEVVSGVFRGEDLRSKLGRDRRFGLITYQNIKHVRNEILNFYPQATGSDSALMAGRAVQIEVADPSWLRPVAFVHDAFGYYIRKGNRGRIPEIIKVLERVPQEALNTDVTFKVDAKIGDSWGSLKDLSL